MQRVTNTVKEFRTPTNQLAMSVRTEPRDISQQLQQTLTIPAEVMTAAAAHNHQTALVSASAGDVGGDQHLHEANTFNNTNEHHPLERTVCVNIRASLSDLCLKTQTAVWAPPSAEATKSIFQQAPIRTRAPGPWPPPPCPPSTGTCGGGE